MRVNQMETPKFDSQQALDQSPTEVPSTLKKLRDKVLQICSRSNNADGPVLTGTFNNVPGSPYTRESERFIEKVAPARLAKLNPGKDIAITVTVTKL